MGTAADYRKRAQECVEMAQKAKPAERVTLLDIASAWAQLADAAEMETSICVRATNAATHTKQ
jgi:hypothetical protein